MTTTEELTRQLAKAKAADAAAAAAQHDEYERREVAFAIDRLAQYDRDQYAAEANSAWQQFLIAFEETPAFAALAGAQAALWRAHQAAVTAVLDATTIARARGEELPRPYEGRPPAMLTPQTLLSVLEAMTLALMEADQEQEHTAQLEALATPLTPDQARKADEARDVGLAKPAGVTGASSIDVTGMSDAERERLGLPAGSSRDRSPAMWR